MVDIREERLSDASRKVVGEHFLGPHIVEPVHGHIIAKPHVSRFVGDELGTCQFLVEGRMFAQEHAGIIIQGSSRVFHASVLESRKDDEAILGKGIRDVGIVLQPMQGCGHLLEDDVQLSHLLRISFPVISRENAFTIGIFHLLQLACYKGE